MLKKLINGYEIYCTEDEEQLIRKKWELNKKFPEYSGHLVFDGISLPYHNLEECKKHHIKIINEILSIKIKTLNNKIEIAQENGENLTNLYLQRKLLRNQLNPNIEKVSKIEELKDNLEKIKMI